jgi:dTMP kinase
MAQLTETLLLFAARSEHVCQVIEPALKRGAWVICDRFTDATYAYQGGGRQVDATQLALLEQWVHPHIHADRTWLFDVPLDVARARLSHARTPDRFESEGAAFFQRTREAYLARARREPERIRIIDGRRSIDDIRVQLQDEIHTLVTATR